MGDNLSECIHIKAKSFYIESESEPQDDYYVFAYTIKIANNGPEPAQLLSRHWFISDSEGETQEVFGEGVVGEKPTILPGEEYEYTSSVVLNTPIGMMEGRYRMVTDFGTCFDAQIMPFSLAKPELLH